jgi:hypothetical protein
MTPHQTLAVAVRLFALWLAIYAARELVGAYVAGRDRSDTDVLPVVTVVSTLATIFVAALWFFPKSIACGLLPLSTETPAKTIGPDSWLAVGSALIGLWLVASAMPGLFRNLFVLYLFRSEAVDTSGVIPGLVFLFVQLAVGAALIFGASAVRRFILWARYAGPG